MVATAQAVFSDQICHQYCIAGEQQVKYSEAVPWANLPL